MLPKRTRRRPGRAANGAPAAYLLGTVLPFTGDECLIWPFARSGDGYGSVWVAGKHWTASRYVCQSTHGPPEDGQVAAHSCGKGQDGCVNPRHIRWASQAENCADKLVHGTHARGERHRANKLSEAQAREILASPEPWLKLASHYGVSKSAIQGIKSGKNWRCLHGPSS